MHEWALAESGVMTAVDIANKEDASKITKIIVKVGELQQIELDIFKYALDEIKKGTIMENAEIVLEEEEAILKCRVCGHEWKYKDVLEKLNEDISEAIHFVPEMAHTYIRCPKCNSPDFEVIKGRGVWIKSIEVER